ncbi:MAG: DUF805 domain-containing protein [Terriglobales bacterium]
MKPFSACENRCGRREYLNSSGFIWLVIPLTFGLTMGVFEAFGLHTTVLTDLFLLPYSLLALAIQIWLHIRRLHDLDKSGQHALWLLVPLVGAFYFLYLLTFRGTDGTNKYGQVPPMKTLWFRKNIRVEEEVIPQCPIG